MIRARKARACAVLHRETYDSRTDRSASVSSILAAENWLPTSGVDHNPLTLITFFWSGTLAPEPLHEPVDLLLRRPAVRLHGVRQGPDVVLGRGVSRRPREMRKDQGFQVFLDICLDLVPGFRPALVHVLGDRAHGLGREPLPGDGARRGRGGGWGAGLRRRLERALREGVARLGRRDPLAADAPQPPQPVDEVAELAEVAAERMGCGGLLRVGRGR